MEDLGQTSGERSQKQERKERLGGPYQQVRTIPQSNDIAAMTRPEHGTSLNARHD